MSSSSAAPPAFQLTLFGPFELRLHGEVIPRWHTRQGQWLLALLALHANRPVERSWLAGTVWPESTESQALANLRLSLTFLRRALGAEAWRLQSLTRHTLTLTVADEDVDALEFDRAVEAGDARSLEAAVALYQGPLLAGCPEAWIVPERERRALACVAALERLAKVGERDPARAARFLRRAIDLDPLREGAWRALMEALAGAKDYAGAIQAYRELRALLREELGVEPSQETAALFSRIREQGRQAAAQPSRAPRTEAVPAPRRLPYPLTRLVGREEDTLQVLAVLAESRLVTLVGTGGVGKTRLAICAADRAADEFEEGAWFVDLAPLETGELVLQAVANALGLRDELQREPLDALLSFLRSRELLLVLDNCEQVAPACARLSEVLLQECPRLRALATSRRPLGLPGERPLRVSSLAENAAIELFQERALQAQPAFELAAHHDAVDEICRRLEGIPLALELAAARLSALSPEDIASRLDGCLSLLAGGSRTNRRHETLRATLDWSYNLLSDEQQRLLRRLAIFSGGWTLEAAESICSDCIPDAPDATSARLDSSDAAGQIENRKSKIEIRDVLPLLCSLVDMSLVVYEPRHGRRERYRLLETVRQYALERSMPGDREQTARRHATYYLELAQQVKADIEQDWFRADRLEGLALERNNVLAAIRCWRNEEPGIAQRLWVAFHVGILGGFSPEMRSWIRSLMEGGSVAASFDPDVYRWAAMWASYLGEEASTVHRLREMGIALADSRGDGSGRARILMDLALEQDYRGASERAIGLYEEAWKLYSQAGDLYWAAEAAMRKAILVHRHGDRTKAIRLIEQNLCLGRQLVDPRIISASLQQLAQYAFDAEEYSAARRYLEESLQLHRTAEAVGYRPRQAVILNELGTAAAHQGDYDAACRWLEQALEITIEYGDRPQQAWCRYRMADLSLLRNAYGAAHAYLASAARLFQELGERQSVVICMQKLAQIACAQRQWEKAACLLGYSDHQMAVNGWVISQASQSRVGVWRAKAREALGTLFEGTWKEGAVMTPSEAFHFAFPVTRDAGRSSDYSS